MTVEKKVGPKRAKRRVRWEFNIRLLLVTLIGLSVVSLLVGGRYWTQSRRLSSSLLLKAKQAEQAQDWEEQIRWLQRYRLLFPDDLAVMISLALATDAAVDSPPADRLDRVDRARRIIGDALSALARAEDDSTDQTSQLIEQENQLRRRLIRRQLQFQLRYADEAQRQIIRLGAPHHDAEMLRSMALALGHQMTTESERKREADQYQREQDFWLWLSQQPLGRVTEMASRANQDDLTLSAQLIDLCLNDPDRFDAALDDEAENHGAHSDQAEPFDPLRIAEQVAEHLATKTSSGQAQLILYQYERQTNPAVAADRLVAVATPTLGRLRAYAQQAIPAKSEGLTAAGRSRAELPVLPSPFPNQRYLPQWDYDLVLLSAVTLLPDGNSDQAQSLSDHDRSIATDRLDHLLRLSEFDVPASSIESAYLARGQLSWDAGQAEEALETWQNGIERLAGDSIKLRLTNAVGLVDAGRFDAAAEATRDLSEYVKGQLLDLAGPKEANLGRRQRLDLQSELDSATWFVWLLEGRIALAAGDYWLAIARLQRALNSQYSVPDADRVRAASLLASAFERIGNWDLAATAYERAVYLAPDRNDYRVMAAEAWARAGNSDRSFRQWQAVEGDSPQLAIARLRAIVNEQLSRPSTQRDFDTAAREINKLRALMARLPQQDADQRADLEVSLELLALAIPGRDDGQRRSPGIDQLEELSKRFPDHPELQSVAAVSLAAAGQIEPLGAALSRLKKAVGENSFTYQQTLARTAAIRGDWQAGVDSLVVRAKANPDDARQCLESAADLARANGDTDQAYQLLKQVPIERRTPDLLFDIFSLSMASEAVRDVPDFDAADPLAGPEGSRHKTPSYWEQQLRELEGDSGTWWRLARADRLLAKRDQLKANDPHRASLLSQAEALHNEIQFARPRWGLAHSLQGRLAVIRGESKLAVKSLRRGIAAGDLRASTLLLLVGQLTQDNRVAEAEAEYSRFKQLAGANSAVTTLAVALAEAK